MKLRVTYSRSNQPVDLEITVDGAATVGNLASALAAQDPLRPYDATSPVTVALSGAEGPRPLVPSQSVNDSPLASGATIALAAAVAPTATAGSPVAVLRVVEGPDVGQSFPLRTGSNYVGRGSDMDVKLTDPLVSKSHAKVNVGTYVEIVDNNSSNGLLLGGMAVGRAQVRNDDRITLGDSVICVEYIGLPAVQRAQSLPHAFIRSPRLAPRFAEEKHPVPEIPTPPQPHRFPVIALLTPLLLGAGLYAITRQASSLLFVLFTPVMLIGQYYETKYSGRRLHREAVAAFRENIVTLGTVIRGRQDQERTVRLGENPTTSDVVAAATSQAPLLWTRRPEFQEYLQLTLGLGQVPSRVRLDIPTSRPSDPTLWAELLAFASSVETIEGVPVIADLRACGSVGVAGLGEQGAATSRALVLQLAGLHSPADLVIAACIGSSSADRWAWLKWLPHTMATHSPITAELLTAGAGVGDALISAIEGLIADRMSGGTSASITRPALLLIVEDDAPVDRPRLVEIAERGAAAGVHVMWVAPSVLRLPAACRAYVSVAEDGTAESGFIEGALRVAPLAAEAITLPDATRAARALAPVVDAGATITDASDLPRAVSYLTLAGASGAADSTAIIERWIEADSLTSRRLPGRRRQPGTRRALIGQAAAEPLVLDLRTQGPHALVGGTTGSGKSELLQTWVLGMAAAHSPERVTFLFVDYKGGAAFGECVNLPHAVGLVTDLSPHLVRRALISLDAELKYREHVLNASKAKDLAEMERDGNPLAPPSLVIVVDEFAALAHDVPEFVDGVVNVAQRGRSLGLHLILATQRPAGVIKDNLRANTNLRIALRMADEADSVDILGTEAAASFDQNSPGRAAVKTGPTQLVPFQAAYVGGHTGATSAVPEIAIRELSGGDAVHWKDALALDTPPAEGPTDLQQLVSTIQAAASEAGLATPRRPWLAELPDVVDLTDLETQRDDARLVFGLQDVPERQQQPVVAFEPDRDGNLAIFGAGGSGKSTALRTIAVAAAFTVRGGPVHMYGLDFGARGLHMLEALPHVGAVISGDDAERVTRLMKMLRQTIDERALRFASVQASTIEEYRARSGESNEPRILLALDGLSSFRQSYDMGSAGGIFESLIAIASEGRPVGVHVILTADRASAMPSSLGSLVSRRLVLRVADDNEVAMLGIPGDLFTLESPPGRGFLDGHEVQVGVLGGDRSVAAQSRAVERLAAAMRRNTAWPDAPGIRSMPEVVSLMDLPVEVDGLAAWGIEDESLGSIGIPREGTFIIAGPPGSGRTTALMSFVHATMRQRPGIKTVLFSTTRTRLADAFKWTHAVFDQDSAQDMASRLIELMPQGHAGSWLIVLESAGEFVNGPADYQLTDLIKTARSAGNLIVSEGDTQSLTGSWGLLQALRFSRRGIVLQPDQMDGDMLLQTTFPRLKRADFPPGRGIQVREGRWARVQVGQP